MQDDNKLTIAISESENGDFSRAIDRIVEMEKNKSFLSDIMSDKAIKNEA